MTDSPYTDPFYDRLMALYDAVGGIGEPDALVIPGTPHAKLRPRHAKNGNTYQDPADRTAEQVTAGFLRTVYPGQFLTNVCVVAAFVVPDARTRDGDNMMKHVKDSMNGGVIHDDRQITGEACFTELHKGNPRSVILFGEHESTLDRTVDLAAIAKRRADAARRKQEKIRRELSTAAGRKKLLGRR